jgi:HK97 family phage prohead protease
MVAPAKPRTGVQRATFAVQRAEAEGGRYTMTIAAHDVSRNPFDEIRLEGGVFDAYLRNPVILWGHDQHSLPIGRTTALRFQDGVLKADFEFLPDDPMAERVRNAWDRGFVRAASISFMPLEVDESDRSKPFGVISKWELLEWSLVTVPADPDALRTAERELDLPEGTLGHGEEQRLTEMVEALSARVDELAARLEPHADLGSHTHSENQDDDEPNDDDPPADDGDEPEPDDEERAISAALAELADAVRAKE